MCGGFGPEAAALPKSAIDPSGSVAKSQAADAVAAADSGKLPLGNTTVATSAVGN